MGSCPRACPPRALTARGVSMGTGNQYTTEVDAAKYQDDARKLPASCQDWDGRLCYTPGGTEHVDRIMVLWVGRRRVRVMWRTARDLDQIRSETAVALGCARPSSDA